VGFGCMGLVLALWTISCLWCGEIRSRRSVICRSTDPFQFYALVFGYSLMATLFIGAGILFWLHPQFSLDPSFEQGLDEW
jgi:hypothetical protein